MADGANIKTLDPVAEFDFRNPNYVSVFTHRAERLQYIRENPGILPSLRKHYQLNPADFINDWGMTYDPRNVERGLPAEIPFILFDNQRNWVEWVVDRWHGQEDAITEKTRDMGMSWLSVALAATLCLFHDGMTIGFGSRKEEYVDKSDSPKSLFWKLKMFVKMLPPEFRGNWNPRKHSAHMRIHFPDTGSYVNGEAGDGIGRGDRASIYFVDEAAFLDRPQLTDAALSQTTNCRQDISTPNGSDNSFAQKRLSGRLPVFTFHWRDDPRKDDDWYDKQVATLDAVVVAQEIDIDYNASKEGILIPSEWVQAAIGADEKLGLDLSGSRFAGFDVADGGRDQNSVCSRQSVHVDYLKDWSGKGSDIFESTQKVFGICDELKLNEFMYDADGLGAGVKGDARKINDERKLVDARLVEASPFRGSGSIVDPDDKVEGFDDRINKDFFANAKAQAWWSLRSRFQKTFRAVKHGQVYPVDQLISIDKDLELLTKLSMELSQPTFSTNSIGKVVVDKTPEGVKSPNNADSLMIVFAPKEKVVLGFFNRG